MEDWKDEAYDIKKYLLLCQTSLSECINTLPDEWKTFYNTYHSSAESHDSNSIMCKCGTAYIGSKETMHKKTKKHTKWAFCSTGTDFSKKWDLLLELNQFERDLKKQASDEKVKNSINIEELKSEIEYLQNQLDKEKQKTKTDTKLEESGRIFEKALAEAKLQKELLSNDASALKKLKLKFHPDIFQSTQIGNEFFTAITKALN